MTKKKLCKAIAVAFFFQAEDGIRVLTVTGVQTCALPIWLTNRAGVSTPAKRPHQAIFHPAIRRQPTVPVTTEPRTIIKQANEIPSRIGIKRLIARSEERGVGKECSTRWER